MPKQMSNSKENYLMDDSIVRCFRMAFGQEYKDMWIDPVYYLDDHIIEDHGIHYADDLTEQDRSFRIFRGSTFPEAGCVLYPKITKDLAEELRSRGFPAPKRPVRPKKVRKDAPKEAKDRYRALKNKYDEEYREYRDRMDEYAKEQWKIIHEDMEQHVSNGYKPKAIVLRGTREKIMEDDKDKKNGNKKGARPKPKYKFIVQEVKEVPLGHMPGRRFNWGIDTWPGQPVHCPGHTYEKLLEAAMKTRRS